jgi:hypothetical protein
MAVPHVLHSLNAGPATSHTSSIRPFFASNALSDAQFARPAPPAQSASLDTSFELIVSATQIANLDFIRASRISDV